MNLPPLPFNPWLLGLLVLIAAGALVSVVRAGAPVVQRRIHLSILLLRVGGLLSLVLALLNPFWRTRLPDPDAYRIAVLVDTSASMETQDLPAGQSRLEWTAGWLDPDKPGRALESLADPRTPVEVKLFSSDVEPWNLVPPTAPLPGLTAIGDALESAHAAGAGSARRPLGGVLLVSDGGQLAGMNPTEAARLYARDGIPVSVIGVGQRQESGDVSVEFSKPRLSFTEGLSAAVEINLNNNFQTGEAGQLALYRNDALLEQRAVTIAAGEDRTETFAVEPGAAGVETFRAVYTPEQERGNPATNVSFSIAEVQRDGGYRFLLLSARAGWESRFLRLLAMESGTIEMDSIIRIDAGRFIRLTREAGDPMQNQDRPARRETLDALPTVAGEYLGYDAIILDLPMILEESEVLAPILEEFAGTKGGGILLLHAGAQADGQVSLPGSLRDLFPVRDFSLQQTADPLALDLEVNPLFSDQSGGVLFSGAPPALPEGTPLAIPSGLSRAAQVPVATAQPRTPVLATQAYGAGRCASLTADFLWRWRLADARSSERFAAFWEAALSWLAVGGKDRLVAPVNATMVPIEEQASLGVTLLGRDYTPRMDASVKAILTGPKGTVSEQRLLPDIQQPGRYTLEIPLQVPGPYQIEYEALFPDGDRLTETSWFAVAATSAESRDTGFKEKTLRDIARITSGEYHSFKSWPDLLPLPVSDAIPLIESKSHWTRTLPFLVAALSLFLAEWWLRRRHGLR